MARTVSVDVSQVLELAADLRNAASVIGVGAARGVNAVAASERKGSVREIVSKVNMRESYVDPKIIISQNATPAKLTAIIETPVRGVMLGNFGAQQQSIANVWTPAMYAEIFGSLNTLARPNPKAGKMPWTPRKGDALRAIAPGAKAAGLNVAIRAGSAVKLWSHTFFMPLRNAEGKFGTFSRAKGSNKLVAKYGPSIDQIVKNVWADNEQDIAARLSESVLDNVIVEVNKELKL